MPTPALYEDATLDPLAEQRAKKAFNHPGILYATLRPPTPQNAYPFYQDERATVLRLGRARVTANSGGLAKEQLVRLSLAPERDRKITLEVAKVEEFGILSRSESPFSDPCIDGTCPPPADGPFAAAVQNLLNESEKREIFVYVHGYNVPFPDPIIVAAEFWHFLGYQGAFIAFSWPSTPSRWAYFADVDSAAASAHGFRTFLTYLSKSTNVEKIHILAYSAGTALVVDALYQIALIEGGLEAPVTRIGKVVLTSSIVDRAILGLRLEDGILDRTDQLTLYLSERDRALSLLQWFRFRPRVGEMWAEGEMPILVRDYIESRGSLALINVIDAEGATMGNGHGYFRNSPWVSSDIISSFLYDLSPQERGLVGHGSEPVWLFPDDYPQRLRAAVGPTVDRH